MSSERSAVFSYSGGVILSFLLYREGVVSRWYHWEMLGPGLNLNRGCLCHQVPPHAVLRRVQALRHLPATTLFLVSFEMLCLCIQQLVTCSVNIQEGTMTSPQRWHGDGVTGVSKVIEAREVVGSAGANPPD